MEKRDLVAGQPCPFCGAEVVRNPKTGKLFCSAKCWLKDKVEPTIQTQPTEEKWDKIGDAKMRTKIAEAYIGTSREFDVWKEEADKVCEWIKNELPF